MNLGATQSVNFGDASSIFQQVTSQGQNGNTIAAREQSDYLTLLSNPTSQEFINKYADDLFTTAISEGATSKDKNLLQRRPLALILGL